MNVAKMALWNLREIHERSLMGSMVHTVIFCRKLWTPVIGNTSAYSQYTPLRGPKDLSVADTSILQVR